MGLLGSQDRSILQEEEEEDEEEEEECLIEFDVQPQLRTVYTT